MPSVKIQNVHILVYVILDLKGIVSLVQVNLATFFKTHL